jgi:predicted phage baseplate assembly protein
MRVKAGLFGQQVPGAPQFHRVPVVDGDTIVQISHYAPFTISQVWPTVAANANKTNKIYLDREYDKILPGSWVVVDVPGSPQPFRVTGVATRTLSAFGVSLPVTELTLDGEWQFAGAEGATAAEQTHQLRLARVYAQSEPLDLVDEPVTLDITGPMLELDALYDGLQSGKWVIVEGERTDLPGSARVKAGELMMIANVIQDTQMVDEGTPLPGDRPHTFLEFAGRGLKYRYRRGSVRVYANVVKATHGETRAQVLGGGDASRAFQSFELMFKPLTYLPAPTADGAEVALELRVDGALWDRAPNLMALGPVDHGYTVKINDDGRTWVIFGDGVHGARLTTAPENVRARYRNGMGKAGNARAGRINLLLSRPPGLKDVLNPLPASGGADREGPDAIRRSAPLALKALDRLVSVLDYEDFCRIYAGIGKARAAELPAAGGFLVHITIAGDDDIPIDPMGDLYRNLVAALRKLGDPHQPFRVALRERVLPVISAGVRIDPRYTWEDVESRVRSALLALLSFERRELGDDITASEVIAAIQNVRGVRYVDLDALDRVDQARLEAFLQLQGERNAGPQLDIVTSLNLKLRPRIPVELARPDPAAPLTILSAQLAHLDGEIADLLTLKEIA